MTMGKNDDAARDREDSFLADLMPQVTEHLAERYAGDFDAEAGEERFEGWLSHHMTELAAQNRDAEDPAGAGSTIPPATRRITRFLGWRRGTRDAGRGSGRRSGVAVKREESPMRGSLRRRGGTTGTGNTIGRRRPGRAYSPSSVPERDEVLRRVDQLTSSLDRADEGTSAVLDNLIDSWVSSWIADVESDYVARRAVIAAQRGRTVQWLAENTRIAGHERNELERISAAYDAYRSRFGDELAERGVGGRGRTVLAVGGLLVLAGALAVTVAFRYTLTLAFPALSGILAWLTAAGATCLSLAAAANAGISLAIRRQAEHGGSGPTMALTTLGWAGLGLAIVLIPLLGTGALFTPLAALLSGAIYLASGGCTVFQAERLYISAYFAFRQLARQYRKQVLKAARAQAIADRAAAALEDHSTELNREDERREALIASRKALGAEAANYARFLMAVMPQRPAIVALAKTGTGPEPMPAAAAKAYEIAARESDFDPGEAGRPTSRTPRADTRSRSGPPRLNGENCTIVLTDVLGFGDRYRNDEDRRLIRQALFEMQTALATPPAWSEDRGDGFLSVIPPTVSTARIMERLDQLAGELEQHNSALPESARFKLRVAVNVGPVSSDFDGVHVGEGIIVAARLVEARAFKMAIDQSAGSLGIIASPFVYETVIRHASDQAVMEWSEVPVQVKETNTTAWMRIFANQTRDRGSSDDSYEIRSRRG